MVERICPDCLHEGHFDKCPGCGLDVAEYEKEARRRAGMEMGPAPKAPEAPPVFCYCGAQLHVDEEDPTKSQCSRTGLYPIMTFTAAGVRGGRKYEPFPCPFACPHCRGRLDWDGGCPQCYGSIHAGDKTTWSFPGDRYEREEESERGPIGFHWRKIKNGGRSAVSGLEDEARARLVNRQTDQVPRGRMERESRLLPVVKIGACQQHPTGCGRSGRAWDLLVARQGLPKVEEEDPNAGW